MIAARVVALSVAVWVAALPAAAQDESRIFAGGLFGMSILSPDAQSVTEESGAEMSLYEPANGLAFNGLAGVHLAQYFSVQANWIWNRNDLILFSSFLTPQGGGFYEQRRRSGQHAVVLDGLIYFRRLDSVVRPYLGTGIAFVRFSSADVVTTSEQGLTAPVGEISSSHLGLRSHVGIDLRFARGVSFRYSFSETISSNPISPALTPPGRRGLMNFQNLFGLVGHF
jgi:hypothetical protein